MKDERIMGRGPVRVKTENGEAHLSASDCLYIFPARRLQKFIGQGFVRRIGAGPFEEVNDGKYMIVW